MFCKGPFARPPVAILQVVVSGELRNLISTKYGNPHGLTQSKAIP